MNIHIAENIEILGCLHKTNYFIFNFIFILFLINI